MDLAIALAGLALLLVAGDLLVRGSVSLSLKLGIPPLIVGLTVVAFGTSAPELLVSVQAALEDAPGIAFGNVVGSNIVNVLLVLGAPALISTLDGRDSATSRSFYLMIAVSVVFIGLCFAGPLDWRHGLVLLGMLAFMIYDQVRDARAHRARDSEQIEVEGVDPGAASTPGWRIALFIILGLIGLPLGGGLLIDGARNVALSLGVSEAVIGLTLVAVGTSMPELATTLIAAFRRQADVALGNVIGSNIFNLAGVLGVASMVTSLEVPASFLTLDLWVMLGASLILFPFVTGRAKMTRPVGAGLIAIYAAYVYATVAMGFVA